MRVTAAIAATCILWSSSVSAQVASRVYAGAAFGAHTVSADDVETGSLPAAGGTIGIRLTPAWSVQLDASPGFGELSRTHEGIGVSFAGPGSTREEIERLGVLQRFEHRWTPRFGWSAVAVWRGPGPRRVTAALFAGVASTHYRMAEKVTTLRIPSGVDPAERSIQPTSQSFTRSRGGLVGGVMVPIALTREVSVAPEIRYTYGSFGDELYTVFGSGVRVLWRF
jgi:outer membrane protein with beta-barrel domain